MPDAVTGWAAYFQKILRPINGATVIAYGLSLTEQGLTYHRFFLSAHYFTRAGSITIRPSSSDTQTYSDSIVAGMTTAFDVPIFKTFRSFFLLNIQ
ncbi:hypothetical protein HRbin03_00020 [archaeon HR03]|nr:hypothetical protein HRbin03_00020 [archaeon HR03]